MACGCSLVGLVIDARVHFIVAKPGHGLAAVAIHLSRILQGGEGAKVCHETANNNDGGQLLRITLREGRGAQKVTRLQMMTASALLRASTHRGSDLDQKSGPTRRRRTQ